MTEQEYSKIKSFAMGHLVPALHGQHLEDCTQYVAMIASQKPYWSWKHILIGYLRENGLTQKRPKAGAIALSRSDEIIDWMPGHNPNEEVSELDELKQRFELCEDILLPRERSIMRAYIFECENLREIGESMGLTESRISQLVNSAQRKMKAHYERVEFLQYLNVKPEVRKEVINLKGQLGWLKVCLKLKTKCSV